MENLSRQERELRTYRLLDRLNIPYKRIDHAPAMTMEDCLAVDQALDVKMCKNLFLCNRQQTVFYLLMMPGDKKFRTKDLSSQLGCARLSFADERFLLEYLDIHPGSVSIMGLMNDRECRVQLVIDRPIAESLEVGCHPCVSTASLKLKTKDIVERFLPAVEHTVIVVDLPYVEI